MSSKLSKLRDLVRLHTNWLRYVTLGEDSLSPEEVKELNQYGKLPMNSTVSLTDRAFVLGRMKAMMTTLKYRDVSWDDLEVAFKHPQLSDVERAALLNARVHAATGMKNIERDLEAGALQLAQASTQQLTEAAVRDHIRGEVTDAIARRHSADMLASKLQQQLGNSRDWRMVAQTELHRAKTQGVAHTILSKRGPYRKHGGPDARAVVIPAPNACSDCRSRYLDGSGNPIVFRLQDLLLAGSNADSGVSHKRDDKGLHGRWKTTLPPLHPRCGCQVQFVPPGTAWQQGALVVVDPQQYQLSKSGSDGVGNPTNKPKGPPPDPSKAAVPHLPSVSGMKSPAQAIKGGAKGPKGPEVDYVPKDSVSQRPPGTVGETEHSYKVIGGVKPGVPLTPEQEEAVKKEEVQSAITQGKAPAEHAKIIQGLATGEITQVEKLDEGVHGAKRVVIEGHGRACLKPVSPKRERVEALGNLLSDGGASVPLGSEPQNEASAYSLATSLGLSVVPPTTVREHEGETHSVQQWLEGYSVAGMLSSDVDSEAHTLAGGPEAATAIAQVVRDIMSSSPDPEKTRAHLDEIAVLDIVMNNNDRHQNNLMVNTQDGSVRGIDHGLSFGAGLVGHKNIILAGTHKNGMKVRIPPHLQERLSKMSLTDFQRAMPDAHPEAAAHAFLRTKYILHLQETEGHLDYHKFAYAAQDREGYAQQPLAWQPNMAEKSTNYLQQAVQGKAPHQQFEAFAQAWIRDNAGTPDGAALREAKLDFGPQDLWKKKYPDKARPTFTEDQKDDEMSQLLGRPRKPVAAAPQAVPADPGPKQEAAAPAEGKGTVAAKKVKKSLYLDLSRKYH